MPSSWLQPMVAFVLILLFFFLNCSPNSYTAAEDPPECAKESKIGYVGDLRWSTDSSRLYFAERTKDYKKIDFRVYDLLARATSTVYAGPNIAFFTINDCDEIFVPTYKDQVNSSFIISSGGTRYYSFEELKQIIYPAWLSNCSEVVFYGCGRQDCGVFLWNKNSNDLRQITPFPFETKRPDGVVVHYMYMRFAPSFVARRIIFGYDELHVYNHKADHTFNLGAMDLETGKAWKITELGNIDEGRRWYSSDIEDAIYFFKWNEAGFLDSLWKVNSEGTAETKLLDGKKLHQAEAGYSLVSWSKNGDKFAISYHDSSQEEDRIDVVDTGTGHVRNLGLNNTKSFALSPDGMKLAYVTRENEVHLLDVESSTDEMIFSAR